MANLIYDYALDDWRDWQLNTYAWAFLNDTHPSDSTNRYLSELTSYELAPNQRVVATNCVRSIDTVRHRVTYACDAPIFTPDIGQTIGALVLYQVGADDTASPLMALIDITDTATDGNPFNLAMSGDGIHYIDAP
jgi:hypothetical protein